MIRVAIVGSREFRPLSLVRAFVEALSDDTVVVSGHARGVDRAAETAAEKRGLKVVSLPADWDHLGQSAGYLRNHTIVEQADVVVAFHDGFSRGTKSTIRIARTSGKPVFVVNEDGEIVP